MKNYEQREISRKIYRETFWFDYAGLLIELSEYNISRKKHGISTYSYFLMKEDLIMWTPKHNLMTFIYNFSN